MTKTRKQYRVYIKSFNSTAGFGLSPAEAIANLKDRVTGDAIAFVMKLLADDDIRVAKGEMPTFHRYDTALAKLFNDYKTNLLDNGSFLYDVWEQEYDENRGEWITRRADTWSPKYPIKL